MTLDEKRTKVAELLAVEIEWDGDRGYFNCPLAERHTTPTNKRDTVLYLDGVPTSYCWHQSCQEWHTAANSLLRSTLDDRTAEEKREDKDKRLNKRDLAYESYSIQTELRNNYERYQWNIFSDQLNSEADFRRYLTLWSPRDVIWIGECYNTGASYGRDNFRSVGDWSNRGISLKTNHYTCASTFRPGTSDRTNKEVLTTPYLVVEFDQLDKDKEENKRKGAALLNYLRQSLDLRMVVDSGNKSLHGWFLNNEKVTEECRFLLRQLGADINTMRPSQPVRLPGAIRENGNVQAILWMSY